MSLIRNLRDRRKNQEDIGLDRQGQRGRQRTINRDGTYNIKRITGDYVDFDLFHWLINTKWTHYWLAVFGFYTVANIFFAALFYQCGPQNIAGILPDDGINDFLQCYFFSNQTFTTVGYGGMHPTGEASSWVASIEAFVGLMSFVIATGTLYGRFSKPKQKVKYSANALIAPHHGGHALQFMAANGGRSNLMEVEATVNFSWVEAHADGTSIRRFERLELELSKIAMFPTSWIINHPIDEESPLYQWTQEEMEMRDIEIFCTLKAFDETFSGTVYSRMSYTGRDLVYGAKFKRPFSVDENGQLVMDLRMVGEYDRVER
ncbi:MAG: ion channel [Chitinophagales bacterium]